MTDIPDYKHAKLYTKPQIFTFTVYSLTFQKKPKVPGLDTSFQLSIEKWAQFECPEEFRQAFKHDRGPCSINSYSISMQVSDFP